MAWTITEHNHGECANTGCTWITLWWKRRQDAQGRTLSFAWHYPFRNRADALAYAKGHLDGPPPPPLRSNHT